MSFTTWRLWIFVFYVPCILGNDDGDPCFNHSVLDAGPRLHTLNENNRVCDNDLVIGWYKLMIGNVTVQIPTSCLQNNVCGTQLPLRIDLGGQVLPTTGNILHAHVCTSYNVLGQWDCCVLRQSVVIKKCSDFFVYKLQPTDRCPVAYCAEDPDDGNYQDILVKRGEYVPSMSTVPPVEVTTQVYEESQTTSMNSPNNTDASSVPPVLNGTNSTSSLDTTTTPSVINVDATESVGVENATDISSTPFSNLSSDDVTTIVPNMTSENETNSKLFIDTSTVSVTTPTAVNITNSINETNDSESTPVTLPSSTVTDVTRASQQATETSLGEENTTLNSSSGTTASSAGCINWQTSRCPDRQTICYMMPASNDLYVLCDNGSRCGLICNSFPDCNDGKDERKEICPSTRCLEGMIKCKDANICYIRCDGTEQCINSSHPFEDENNCQDEPNVTITTGIFSNNMSTINETIEVSTISQITSQPSSESRMTSVQSATTSPISTVDTPMITDSSTSSSTADGTVEGAPTEQLTIVTSQPNNDVTDTTSGQLSINESVSDITTEYISNTTSSYESITTAVVNVSLTTSGSVSDISATDQSVTTTNISQTVPQHNDSIEDTTLKPMSSISHTSSQPEASSGTYSDVSSSTTYQPINILTSTRIQTVSTDTDVLQYATTLAEDISTSTNPGSESHASSTQGIETSSSPTSKNASDVLPTTDSESAETLSTQSSDALLLTTIPSSRSSSQSYPGETSSSSNPTTTSDVPKTSSAAELPSSSFEDLPRSSIKTTVSESSSSVPLTTVSTSSKYSAVDSTSVEAKLTTGKYNINETDSDNSTAVAEVPIVTKQPAEDEKDGLIHDNFGLFVFIIVASACILAISIFGIVGYTYQQRRLRTWTPRMAYQDAYADLEKKNLAYGSTLTGIESPIPDIDIMHEEKVMEEETSLSQASTLVLSPSNGRESSFEQELRDSPSPKSINNEGPTNVGGGKTNEGFQGDNIDGIVPVEEIDNEAPRAFFPWIESAEDTKL